MKVFQAIFRKAVFKKCLTLLLPLLLLLSNSKPASGNIFWNGAKSVVNFFNPLRGLGSDASQHLADAIKNAKLDVNVNVGVDDADIQRVEDRVRALIGYTATQATALSSHVSGDIKDNINNTFDKLENYSNVLDKIAKNRIDQLDQAAEDRIRQTFKEIEDKTLVISQELSNIIRQSEEAVNRTIDNVGEETRETIRTASDELESLLGVATEDVNFLLNSSSDQLLRIMDAASGELASLIRLTSAEVRETSGFVIEKTGGETRLTLVTASNEVKDVTREVSQQTLLNINNASDRLEGIISKTSGEVQEIIREIASNHLIVIEGGLFLVDRVADLILVLGASGFGTVFLFVSAYGWGRAILVHHLPERRGIQNTVVVLMGVTFVVSVAPFIFLVPLVRARVLLPVNLAKPLGERIPRGTVNFPNYSSDSPAKQPPSDIQSPASPKLDGQPNGNKLSSPKPRGSQLIQFPRSSCGDVQDESRTLYAVYVDFRDENNLTAIKQKYCGDAYESGIYERKYIIVATFENLEQAKVLADRMRNEVGSGYIGDSSQDYKVIY